MNLLNLFTGTLILIIMLFMVSPFSEAVDTTTGKVCYENECSKTTLDEFDKCIDLGYESSGFLSGNHYYLCDGVKVTSKCLEYKEFKTKKEYISFGMRCDYDVFDMEDAE